jgi:hypothetical protein
MRLIFLFLFAFLIGCGNNSSSSTSKGIIVPAYFDDASLWDKLINSSNNNMIIIANPNNGPGDKIDDFYLNNLNNLQNKKPIGYIYTKWGDRNISEVENDIDKWIKFYPIKGFFVDESATNEGNLSYYTTLYNYIKSKGNYYIVLNPGTMPNEKYFEIADNIVIFEDDIKNLNIKCSQKSSIIAYNASQQQMQEVLQNYNCDYFYITDKMYDELPSYFDEESK